MSASLNFDHTKFFNAYRDAYGRLKQSQVDGIESLLNHLQSDTEIKDLRWAAYMLATVKHECGDTWQPIEEWGKGKGRSYGAPVDVIGSDGKTYSVTYYGRGYVQLTWKDNYEKMSRALGLADELLIHPQRALDPDIAYQIMSWCMRHGAFTGKKLADYIHDDECDYKNARRIINGLDQWERIKGYADNFETFLKQSTVPQSALSID